MTHASQAHPPSPQIEPCVLVIMGVTGSGKTTIGAMLAGRLHWHFADADSFHSAANIEKMHSGIPLTDEDRQPWLQAIAEQIDSWLRAGEHGVVTCSALKKAYRDVLIGSRKKVRLVYLKGDRKTLMDRLRARHGHFMPPSLLTSQLDTLEEPGPGEKPITVDITGSARATVSTIIQDLEAGG